VNVEHPLGAFHRLLGSSMIFFAQAMASPTGSQPCGWPTEFDGPLRANAGARQRKLLGQQQTDMQRPGQRPTVGGHQPHLHVWIRKVRAFGDVDDVAERDQAAAEPTAGPFTAATTGIRQRAMPSTISRRRGWSARRSASFANSSR